MAYDETDPRSQLATAPRPPGSGAGDDGGANVAPQYFEFDRTAAAETSAAGSATWWVRSQSCVVAYTAARAGDRLHRSGQPDEYVALLHDPDGVAVVTAGDERIEATGRSLVVIPPGDSSVTLASDGPVVRLLTTRSADLCARTANAPFYERPDPNVAPFRAWPDPPEGHRIRAYAIDAVEPSPDRFGRIYRCSTFMVNYFYDAPGPRDPTKMSPHHHDDFEQLSLQLEGDYVHHIRTPWTVDIARWRDDEHARCTSPSVTVIPPPAIHTSQAVGDTPHQLIDVFCPPRADFSERPGWVLNADEYPPPGG